MKKAAGVLYTIRDKKTGQMIAQDATVEEALHALGLKCRTSLYKRLFYKTTAKRYDVRKVCLRGPRRVAKIDPATGKVLRVFDTIAAAAEDAFCSVVTIRYAADGTSIHHKGIAPNGMRYEWADKKEGATDE